ncbi:MAG: DoxX family membrane protein [Actinomycetota bacterium]|jgi:thiosulfate dehydrogenase [quinone] large subunit|nr:DoxX family membrane protein [Actinomycetota bacterium]
MNGMAWVRILIGAVWLNGAIEKLLNPDFPQQFAASLNAGGFVSQAPPWFQSFMQSTVIPNAELFAQIQRFGELALGLALILGLLTNPAALGSIVLSLAILLSQGGVRLGTGIGSPEILTINLLVALISLLILLSPAAKALSLDEPLARGRPRLAPLLTNRRTRGGRRSRA